MEYLITDIEFNNRYKKHIKKNMGLKNTNLYFKQKTGKKNRKQREYKNRIPKKYSIYIKSVWWTKRRNRYYREHKRVCAICGGSKYCNLHHLVYRNNEFGNERDTDLVCLCHACHEEYHSIYGTSGNMNKTFAEFCASKVNNPIV